MFSFKTECQSSEPMSVNQNKLVKLSSKPFFTTNNKLQGKNLQLRDKTKASLNIRLIKKETYEYQRLRKMSFSEIIDFQCIYLTKLQCRTSQKYQQTFMILSLKIRDNTNLSQCTGPASQIPNLITATPVK